MSEQREDPQTERGFTVSDRRFSSRTTERRESRPQETPPSGKQERSFTLPPVSFSTFLLSQSSLAMMYLGEIPDPVSQQKVKNLELAKHTIDTLAMLEEKTRGNLTPDEEQLLKDLLYDLRMRYVQAVKK
ncbi:MAG: DUF1844 domain-containing protein [Nitrospinota bacterium]|nr:MAG: DUF1844 domain-containing protein [Nitrospinota bacterium]